MKSSSSIELIAADGQHLAANLFAAPEPRGAVLLAGAMGVRRRFYAPMARWLATQGLSTMIVDYRGIGDSFPCKDAALHQWGDLDLPAALAELKRRVPGVPVSWFGHSVGGQLFGLMPADCVDRAVFIGSQSGHWRNWDGVYRAGMWTLWHVGIPVLTTVTGRLPMKALGQGEDLPREVAREWARWGRSAEYIGSYPGLRADAALRHYRGPLTLYAVLDDLYAPKRSVEALAQFYPTAVVEDVDPRDRGMGHFGPFWPSWSDSLWVRMAERLAG